MEQNTMLFSIFGVLFGVVVTSIVAFILLKSKEKTVIISENQTHGKGTKERVWYSSYGDNILMTLVFYPRNSIQELQHLTYDIAKMIQSAIKDLYNILLDIKLPNDLMLNGKKICGILTESSIQGDKLKYLLIGKINSFANIIIVIIIMKANNIRLDLSFNNVFNFILSSFFERIWKCRKK